MTKKSATSSTEVSADFSRNTKQRDAILAAFGEANRPLKPEEVLKRASKKVSRMGLATVYRAIKTCVEQGVLETVTVPGEPSRYELAGKHHHHHFLCRKCDSMFEVDRCFHGVEKGAPSGFVVEDHHVTLFGVCSDCRS